MYNEEEMGGKTPKQDSTVFKSHMHTNTYQHVVKALAYLLTLVPQLLMDKHAFSSQAALQGKSSGTPYPGSKTKVSYSTRQKQAVL